MEEKFMKRFLSAAAAAVIALALCVSAFAAYDEPVEMGLFIGNPDNGGWSAVDTVEVTDAGEYTLSYDGDAKELSWIIIKNNAGEQEPTSIPEGTVIRTTSVKVDGEELGFRDGDSYESTVGANGTIEIQYYNTFTGNDNITGVPAEASSIEVRFVVDPDNASGGANTGENNNGNTETPSGDNNNNGNTQTPSGDNNGNNNNTQTPSGNNNNNTQAPSGNNDNNTSTQSPATGVVMATLPAVIAAAALVVSKRK